MKKKFVKVVLFGALTLAASASFVGCKDYDDDVKGLQEQIDAINKKEAGVTKAEMTAAIASAISDLKTKLETAIAGKADNATVQALQAKVTELTTALSGKADASKITELINQITALSTEVNSVKGSLDATKATLEGEIAGLKTKIAELEAQIGAGESGDVTSLREELLKLNTQLVESQNKLAEVTAMVENNAAEIAKLTARITELSGLQAKIDQLEAAQAEFVKTGDLTAYDGEIKAYIDQKMLDYLTSSAVDNKIDAVYQYVDGVFKTKLMTELESIYEKIGAYDAKIEDLTKKFDAYAKQQGLDDLMARVKTLEDYKTATLNTLVETINGEEGLSAKVAELVNALGDITDLSDKFSKYTTTEDLEKDYLKKGDLTTEIDNYLKTQLSDNTASLAELAKELKSLSVDVKGLIDMVQSVVFVPEYADGQVVFKTLKYNGIAVSRTTDAILTFRVSPANAAEDFAKRYKPSFDAQVVKTRGNAVGTVFKGEPTLISADETTGLVKYQVNASDDATESYAVCMNLTSIDKADGSKNFTDINSNYFVVKNDMEAFTDVRYYNKVGFDNPTTGSDDIIIFDDAASKIDYTAGSYYEIRNGGGSWVKLVGYDLSKFAVNFELAAGADVFNLNNGVLSLKEIGVRSNIDKTVTVKTNVTIQGVNDAPNTPHVFTKNYQQVTVKEKATNASAVYTETLEWNAAIGASRISLDMTKLYDAAGMSQAEFEGLWDTTTDITSEGGLVLNLRSYQAYVQLPVASNIQAGTFKLTGTIKIKEAKTISVTVNVTIKTPADITPYKLLADPNFLSGGTAIYSPAINQGVITSPFSLNKDLKQLFGNFASAWNNVTPKNGEILFSLVNPADAQMVSLSGSMGETLTYNPAKYTGKAIAIKAEVLFGGVAVDTHTFNVEVADVNKLNGTWAKAATAEDAIVITDANKATANQLFTGFSWKDGRGKQMWINGKISVNASDFTMNPFDAYYLQAPTFEIVGDVSGYFNPVSYDGKISLSAAGRGIQDLAVNYVITVKVKVVSPWGAVSGATDATTKVTVTIPRGFTF